MVSGGQIEENCPETGRSGFRILDLRSGDPKKLIPPSLQISNLKHLN
jgi:hypothetical protein